MKNLKKLTLPDLLKMDWQQVTVKVYLTKQERKCKVICDNGTVWLMDKDDVFSEQSICTGMIEVYKEE